MVWTIPLVLSLSKQGLSKVFDRYWVSLVLSLSKDARFYGTWFDRITMSGANEATPTCRERHLPRNRCPDYIGPKGLGGKHANAHFDP